MSADPDKLRLRPYLSRWAANGRFLEKLRDDETRRADTARSIRIFDLAFKIAVRELPPRDSSGLVEWQDFMRRWHGHG